MKHSEKLALCQALLPLLNEMQKSETQIVASTKEPITLNQLMRLTDDELRALEEEMIPKAKGLKRLEKNEKRYNLIHNTESNQFEIK